MEKQEKPQPTPLAYQFRPWCRAVGVSPSTAYAWVRAGKLKILKAGKRSLITADENARFLKEGA